MQDAEPDKKDEGIESKPAPKTYSEEHVSKLIRERDAAKAKFRTVAEALDLQDEYVDDEDNPGKRKLVIKGLDPILSLRTEAAKSAEDGQRRGGKWDERKAEIEQQHTAKVQKMTQAQQRTLAGRDAIITDLAVSSPLREALAVEGAYDADGDGRFGDQIALLKSRLRADIETDDETGKATLAVRVLGDDGSPLLDSKTGDPVMIRQYVKTWLDKRPNQRKANFRPGPTRGDSQYGERGRGTPSIEEHAQKQAAALFGQPLPAN